MQKYIYIDPDEPWIGLVEIILSIDVLCELLRCDSTNAIELFDGCVGYVDGEGSWQGRQTEWEMGEISVWGPMIVFKGDDDFGNPLPCDEDDLEKIVPKIHFFAIPK